MFTQLGVVHENMSGCLNESVFKAKASIQTMFGYLKSEMQLKY